MSWDKNTIDLSDIDNAIEILNSLEIKYKVSILGEVEGKGNNDDMWVENDGIPYSTSRKYQLRRLEYKNKVLVEQMQRTHDCDMHDFLVSLKFKKGEEPKELPLEIYMDEKEYNNIIENNIKRRKKK